MCNERRNGWSPRVDNPSTDASAPGINRSSVSEASSTKQSLVLVGVGNMRCDSKRNGGFADASRADDGHETSPCQLIRNGADAVGAADHPRQRHRQMMSGFRERQDSCRFVGGFLGSSYGSHETIAAACRRIDVLAARRFVTQQFAQRRDVHSQICFFNEGVGPNPLQQILFADEVFPLPTKRSEDPAPGTEPQLLSLAKQLRRVGSNRNGPKDS